MGATTKFEMMVFFISSQCMTARIEKAWLLSKGLNSEESFGAVDRLPGQCMILIVVE